LLSKKPFGDFRVAKWTKEIFKINLLIKAQWQHYVTSALKFQDCAFSRQSACMCFVLFSDPLRKHFDYSSK
jgi:hypothetical protein